MTVNDWIKIPIKFSGLCSNCKKRINSGSYAYWSKISKSILHELCYTALFSKASDIMQLNNNGDDINNEGKKISSDNSYNISNVMNRDNSKAVLPNRRENKVKCYICDRIINFNDDLIKILLNLNNSKNNKSDVLYCSFCLENFNDEVYEKYRKRFMNAI